MNRLSNEEIKTILKHHNAKYFEHCGDVWGIEYYTTRTGIKGFNTCKLSGVTQSQLLHWLGY